MYILIHTYLSYENYYGNINLTLEKFVISTYKL